MLIEKLLVLDDWKCTALLNFYHIHAEGGITVLKWAAILNGLYPIRKVGDGAMSKK